MADPRTLRRADLPDWPLRRWVRWRYCWWLPQQSELRTAYLDVRARLGGWCNHCPQSNGPGGGGYAHWRCQLRRWHTGMHRGVNYVWDDHGRTDYLPTSPQHTDQQMASPWARRQRTGSWLNRIRRMALDRERHKRRTVA